MKTTKMKQRTKKAQSLPALLMALLLLPLAGLAQAGKLTISEGWVRAVPPVSKNTAAYFTIRNGMKKDDTILHLSSPVAEHTELHTIIEEPNGAKRMQKVPHGSIKGGGELELKPGGYHLMLIGLNKALKEGDKVTVEIIFQNAGKQTVTLPVRMGAIEEPSSDHHHHHH